MTNKRQIKDLIELEEQRQQRVVNLVASENYCSDDVREAVGSCLTNKYAEGYPHHKYYGGCQYIDAIETKCQDLWKEVFKTDYHCNVQPHSGSDANQAAYLAFLKPGDTILSMNLNDGGHLSHGHKANISSKIYNIVHYGVNDDGYISEADLIHNMFIHKPNLIVLGASAYPRIIDFKHWNDVINTAADIINNDNEVNGRPRSYKPIIMADIAHIAGLIAADKHPSPFGFCDVITTTTHKTLRGPRGGLIFCKPEYAKKVDSAVFPGIQGGPLMHVIAGKAIAAAECLEPEYAEYIQNVIDNAAAMATTFIDHGLNVVTNGTDNHLVLVDLTNTGISGLAAQEVLEKHNIIVNKNCIHNEKRSPMEASGIRLGSAAMTTLGWTKKDFVQITKVICTILTQLLVRKPEEK